MIRSGAPTDSTVLARSGSEPSLHLPDEPVERRLAWRRAVHGGSPLLTVVGGPGGIAEWLYSRWQSLRAVGIDECDFASITLDYRRELWLWVTGERTWSQSCSGLIGRLERRSEPLADRSS